MDLDLLLTLVVLARQYADVPADVVTETWAAIVAALPGATAEVVDHETRLVLDVEREQRRTPRVPWEWTEEDDAAWRLDER